SVFMFDWTLEAQDPMIRSSKCPRTTIGHWIEQVFKYPILSN
ncbi:7018_t:CDS:1, partial [Cetraspora pellucida]